VAAQQERTAEKTAGPAPEPAAPAAGAAPNAPAVEEDKSDQHTAAHDPELPCATGSRLNSDTTYIYIYVFFFCENVELHSATPAKIL